MGRVLILEPDAEVRALVGRVVARLGHEPLAPASLPFPALDSLDAVVLEPAWAPALELARRLREHDPRLPLVLESIEATSDARAGLRPVRYLVKPFRLGELEEAIIAALA
jgi:two-component SAPR family response regulator